jgi:uncharacterized protein (DUF1800 family)
MNMNFEEGRHLLARTGFMGTPEEIHSITRYDRKGAVTHLLDNLTSSAVTPPPPWVNLFPPSPKERKHRTPEEKKAKKKERRKQGLALKAWWINEMLTTPSPLTERMTLFWHNHFTSSLQKVKWPPFLYDQNVLFRSMACGSFRALLHAVAKGPAMMLYLDTQTNRKGHPNENFARELFELFTLGEGNYSEQDIKEAARAFTGWKLNRRNGAFQLNHRQHDKGFKTVFGQTRKFTGEDILNMAVGQPSTATYLVNKLWREFINQQPDPREQDRLAKVFQYHDFQIKPLLRELLLSPHFWRKENRGVHIKSPIELIAGTIRVFHPPISRPERLPQFSRRLGQDLFDPPNVKGWPGDTEWITTKSLLDRWQLLQRAIRGHEMGGHGSNMKRHSPQRHDHGPDWINQSSMKDIQTLLLPLPPVQNFEEKESMWGSVRNLILDPTYQLS